MDCSAVHLLPSVLPRAAVRREAANQRQAKDTLRRPCDNKAGRLQIDSLPCFYVRYDVKNRPLFTLFHVLVKPVRKEHTEGVSGSTQYRKGVRDFHPIACFGR